MLFLSLFIYFFKLIWENFSPQNSPYLPTALDTLTTVQWVSLQITLSHYSVNLSVISKGNDKFILGMDYLERSILSYIIDTIQQNRRIRCINISFPTFLSRNLVIPFFFNYYYTVLCCNKNHKNPIQYNPIPFLFDYDICFNRI